MKDEIFSFFDLLKEEHYIKVYGIVILEVDKTKQTTWPDFGYVNFPRDGGSSLALILGIRILGKCITLKKPRIMYLPGKGQLNPDCGWIGDEDVRWWEMEKDASVCVLDYQTGPAFQVLAGSEESLGSYPKIDGYIKIKNLKRESDTISGDLEFYGKVKVSPAGPTHSREGNYHFELKINNEASYDFGPLKLTIKITATQVCAELFLKNWRIKKECWEF